MALTTLDPRTALIVIDLQKGIVGGNFTHTIGGIVGRARELLDAFRSRDLPVVLVNVAGRPLGRTEQGPRGGRAFAKDWTDLLPELDRRPSDILVTKRGWGLDGGASFAAALVAVYVLGSRKESWLAQ